MERSKFFRRKPLGFNQRNDVDFIPEHCPNVNEITYAPVMAGMWKQHEVWDGTYTLDDLMDAHEMILVKSENEKRSYNAAQRQGGDY